MLARITQYSLVILILALALSLRSYGLFDGLPHGHVYHPDTPKQLVAATRFMHGEFYTQTGSRDCDGYPYFNSLLCAAIRAPYYWGMRWLHTAAPDQTPAPMTFEFMRVINVLESTLAVLVLYQLVLTLAGYRAAVGAGLLLAVSPIDIVACHSANGDTAAALFALLALLCSIHIYRRGRTVDYVLASLFAVCSFSSKYYGAAAAVPVVLAHLLRHLAGRRADAGSFWAPVATMGITAVAAFFITNPAAVTHPWSTVKTILAFMQYTSNFHAEAAYTHLPLHTRFLKSMAMNGPYLLRVFGPGLCVAAACFTFYLPFQRRTELWLVAAMPLFYIVIGLTMKPAIQTVYHVLITPAVITCAVLSINFLCRWGAARKRFQIIGIILFLFCFVPLANAGWREAVLFKLPDTRMLAANWMDNNVPASFARSGSRYSFYPQSGPEPDAAMGIAWMRSDLREPVLAGDPCIFRIDLEPEDRLTVFRNVPTEIWCSGTHHIRADFRTPFFCLLPATNTSNLIVADAPLLVRTDRRIEFSGTLRRTIFSQTPLKNLFLCLRAAPGRRVEVTINGQRLHLESGATGYAEATCDRLRSSLPLLRRGYLYRFSASTGPEPVLLHVAFTPEEAVAVRECFLNPDAQPRLTDDDFFRTYGVSRAYINALTE